MSIYQHFSYEQLKVVLNQNPSDVEAKKRLDLIESKALKSNDFIFYTGWTLMLLACVIKYLSFNSITNLVLPMVFLGSIIIFLNIDNYLLKIRLNNK